MTVQVVFWMLGLMAFAGAVVVVTTSDVTRLALGLGAFFLAVAGYFALFGFGFLALAEIFVYVGGVLVVVLFAIMLVHRTRPGLPALETRHDLLAAVACLGIFGLGVTALRPLGPALPSGATASVDALGQVLLGPMLPQFELAGVMLLAALVVVVAISAGEDR